MSNYNRIILVGNLTKDPEHIHTQGGTELVKSGIAVNRKRKDKEEVLYVDFVLFGQGCETFTKYLRKGSPVLLEGRLQLESWETQDGQKRSRHTVVVETFQFLGGGERQGGEQRQQQQQPPQQQRPPQQQQGQQQSYTPPQANYDDIPF